MTIYNSTVKQCVQRVPTIFKGKTVNYINSEYWKYTQISRSEGNQYTFDTSYEFADPNKFSAFKLIFHGYEDEPFILISPKQNTGYFSPVYGGTVYSVTFYLNNINTTANLVELYTIGVL